VAGIGAVQLDPFKTRCALAMELYLWEQNSVRPAAHEGFHLADGRHVTLLTGWNGKADERKFLRRIRDGACERFGGVLSPDYNAAHADHFHFDFSRWGFCR